MNVLLIDRRCKQAIVCQHVKKVLLGLCVGQLVLEFLCEYINAALI